MHNSCPEIPAVSGYNPSTEKRIGSKKKGDDTIPPDLKGAADASSEGEILPGANVTPLKKSLNGNQRKIMGN